MSTYWLIAVLLALPIWSALHTHMIVDNMASYATHLATKQDYLNAFAAENILKSGLSDKLIRVIDGLTIFAETNQYNPNNTLTFMFCHLLTLENIPFAPRSGYLLNITGRYCTPAIWVEVEGKAIDINELLKLHCAPQIASQHRFRNRTTQGLKVMYGDGCNADQEKRSFRQLVEDPESFWASAPDNVRQHRTALMKFWKAWSSRQAHNGDSKVKQAETSI